MSRQLVLSAALAWLLIAGVAYVLVSLISGGAEGKPDASPAVADRAAAVDTQGRAAAVTPANAGEGSEIEVAAGRSAVELSLPPYRQITVRTDPPPSPGDELEFRLHTRQADGKWTSRKLAEHALGTARIVLGRADFRRHLLHVSSRCPRTTLVFEGEIDPRRDTITARLARVVSFRVRVVGLGDRVAFGGGLWAGLGVKVMIRRGPLTFEAIPVKGEAGQFRVANLAPGPCRVVVTVRREGRNHRGPGGHTAGFAAVETVAAAGAVVTVPVTVHD